MNARQLFISGGLVGGMVCLLGAAAAGVLYEKEQLTFAPALFGLRGGEVRLVLNYPSAIEHGLFIKANCDALSNKCLFMGGEYVANDMLAAPVFGRSFELYVPMPFSREQR